MESEIGVFSQHWVNGVDRGTRLQHFLAFEPSFTGGASVATGDLDGDGTPKIVAAAGPGRPGEVRVFDVAGKRLYSFFPFGADYTGGLSVATGDLNDDGKAEIVVGTLTPPARVRAFSGRDPYGPAISPFASGGPGAEVAVADLAGNGRGLIVAGTASGTSAELALVDPLTGATVRRATLDVSLDTGIRVAAGDLNSDGRDEVVVTPAFGGDSRVHILDQRLVEVRSFTPYDWAGAGMNVAVATRIGQPIASFARTIKAAAGRRARLVVASFRDAAGSSSAAGYRALVEWGDGTAARGTVIARGGGVFDVRGLKRYARRGRYVVTVTLSNDNRTSIARSRAIVARRR
jgi:FG-GAP repeat